MVNFGHYIEALKAHGWTVGHCGVEWYADLERRYLSLPYRTGEPTEGLIALHEMGHCLDASLAIATAEGIDTTVNAGRVLRAECVAWSWALRHVWPVEWAEGRAAFLSSMRHYIDEAVEALSRA